LPEGRRRLQKANIQIPHRPGLDFDPGRHSDRLLRRTTPINQLATLGVPEANLIIIQPWDSKIINDVDKAIRAANLNINPVSDGKVIKLPIPPLDQQRRLEIIKTMKKYTEERKTHVRNIRREYRDLVKGMKDAKEISEDDEKRFSDELQKLIDATGERIDRIEKDKERHILED
jgi:ribosome recycling factor